MIGISYCVTAKDEYVELTRLLPRLIKYYVPAEDEIIIQLDTNRSDEVYEYCKMIETDGINIHVITFPLNNDFATFKNNLIENCTKTWCVNFDADEMPHESLLLILKELLYNNNNVDLFYLPRVNIVPGIETRPDLVQKWNWNLSGPNHMVNSPDYQGRIFKNKSEIRWKGSVHEKIVGHAHHSFLPVVDDYSILHVKNLDKQISQNTFYDTL